MTSFSNNKKLIIIGAGGHGKVAADISIKMNLWEEIAFLDDDETIQSSLGIDAAGNLGDVYTHIGDSDIFIAIGNNTAREKIMRQMEVELGAGTVVMAGAIINCSSHIGKGCIINTGATVDHDNKIGSYVHISPGAHLAGTVMIGQRTWLGIGSTISNNLSIADDCMIGAGAVVVKDITESGTYVGIPARRLD